MLIFYYFNVLVLYASYSAVLELIPKPAYVFMLYVSILDNFNISLHKALYILYLCLINDNDFDMFTIIWILQMYCIRVIYKL